MLDHIRKLSNYHSMNVVMGYISFKWRLTELKKKFSWAIIITKLFMNQSVLDILPAGYVKGVNALKCVQA